MDLKVLTADKVETAPEILIYFFIEGLGSFIHTMNRAMHRGDATIDKVGEDMENARNDQEQLVEMMKTREGFEFSDHAEYLLWYRWWNQWHKDSLGDAEWRTLNQLLEWDGTQTEETYASYRPEGAWKDQLTEFNCILISQDDMYRALIEDQDTHETRGFTKC